MRHRYYAPIVRSSPLANIAARTLWVPGMSLSAKEIEAALSEAGLPIDDPQERRRFLSLVEDAYYEQISEEESGDDEEEDDDD